MKQVAAGLGCGLNKVCGAFDLTGAEFQGGYDLELRLSLKADSVGVIHMGSVVEHDEDLVGWMGEAYRACWHGAEVRVVAP